MEPGHARKGLVLAKVLVTGGSGFIAAHVMLRLLAEGHEVRATLRRLSRAEEVRAMLAAGGAPDAKVEFHAADLTADAGWSEAAAGADYVMHVASPLPAAMAGTDAELVGPARDGTLRVLRAAREAGVKRVVVTSSFAAVGYGHVPGKPRYDETDWSDPDGPGVDAYVRSKTLAERAAWDFVGREGGGMELSTVNPVGVMGPALGTDLSASLDLVKSLLDGALPTVPRVYFGIVDVRDVAELHLRAMTEPAAAGERFLATASDALSLHEMAQMLRAGLGPAARRVPRFEMPDLLVRLAALALPLARAAVPRLGIVRSASNEKARRLLGWNPRPPEEAILATAESLIRLGVVKG
ncbi:MAG: NAD-dependent epimerase/dehydratase [Xanthobacteraceae bacterium]|jgi:dihydroflavonol-4-reductase|nr:NAD-dependent epimerase/dehydratase [Xanthobacteraceae bacterium]